MVLDEIQAAPNAITSLKYFAEQMPEQPVVGAGSLLGVAVKGREASYPVGKVNTLTLRPMTFEEFLLGIGEGVRISARNFGWAENVQSIPLYAAGTIAARLAAARRAAGLI